MEVENVTKIDRKNADVSRFIEFSLGKENYAVSLLMVREVISVPVTTPIPKSPSHFLGIVNLRGQIISVVDLRKKLKIEAKKDNEEVVIIVDIGGINVGVVVDSINKVFAFFPDEISEMPAVESQLDTRFILGVYKKENLLTVLMDIAKVLDLGDIETVNGQKKAA